MFDLEQSIGKWRRQMLAAGIKTPVPLEELEIHLREEIERQIKSGLNEQKLLSILPFRKSGRRTQSKMNSKRLKQQGKSIHLTLVTLGFGLIVLGIPFLHGLGIALMLHCRIGWITKAGSSG